SPAWSMRLRTSASVLMVLFSFMVASSGAECHMVPNGEIRVAYHIGDGMCSCLIISRTRLIYYFSSISSAESAQSHVGGDSIRSSPFLGTNLAPPSFTDGSTSSAIQRRTVLSETPTKGAISPARRYFGASIISGPRLGLLAVRWRLPL